MKTSFKDIIERKHENKDGTISVWIYKKESPLRGPIGCEIIFPKNSDNSDIYNKKDDTKKNNKPNSKSNTRKSTTRKIKSNK